MPKTVGVKRRMYVGFVSVSWVCGYTPRSIHIFRVRGQIQPCSVPNGTTHVVAYSDATRSKYVIACASSVVFAHSRRIGNNVWPLLSRVLHRVTYRSGNANCRICSRICILNGRMMFSLAEKFLKPRTLQQYSIDTLSLAAGESSNTTDAG